jgi:hypothetical protein
LLGAAAAADGNVLVATAPFEPHDATEHLLTRVVDCSTNLKLLPSRGKGRAYVFERAANGWQQHSLDVSGSDEIEAQVPQGALHGFSDEGIYPTYSVAVSGNVIAFGIGGDGARAPYRGSVRMFTKEASGWTEAAQPIEQPSSRAQDLFGMSVALAGSTLVVGAPSEDRAPDGAVFDGGESNPIVDGGAVYVYELDGTSVSRFVRLVSKVRIPRTYFGYRVALSPDWIAVGAPGEDPDGIQVLYGATYLYRRNASGSVESEPQVLDVPERRALGTFGAALALRGDTLVVGAPTSPGCSPTPQSTAYLGAVHVFKLIDGNWEWQQCLDGPRAPGTFAYTLALGAHALLVGAPLETYAERYFAGTVYEFHRSSGPFAKEPCIVRAPTPMSCGSFGLSLAIADSFVAVGAPYEGSDPASGSQPLDSGSLYTYSVSEPP